MGGRAGFSQLLMLCDHCQSRSQLREHQTAPLGKVFDGKMRRRSVGHAERLQTTRWVCARSVPPTASQPAALHSHNLHNRTTANIFSTVSAYFQSVCTHECTYSLRFTVTSNLRNKNDERRGVFGAASNTAVVSHGSSLCARHPLFVI